MKQSQNKLFTQDGTASVGGEGAIEWQASQGGQCLQQPCAGISPEGELQTTVWGGPHLLPTLLRPEYRKSQSSYTLTKGGGIWSRCQ